MLKSKSFSAVLTRGGDNLGWTVIRLPFDSVKLWGKRGGLRVKGEINGFAFQSSVFPTGDGHHILLVNKKMQKGAGVQPGMTAQFRMEPDLAKREPVVPAELDRLLRTSKRLQKFYQALSGSMRKFLTDSVSARKQPESRARRAAQIAEILMETMEAEIELPPIIRQAFARNPEVNAVWRKMTPLQRRMSLLAVFHYTSLDARLRRIEKLIREMMGKAGGFATSLE